jgi:hypothetical protein
MEESATTKSKETRPLNLWDLNKGDHFVFEDQLSVELIFLGMDGMYAKVRAVSETINWVMCKQYDANSDFFAIMTHGNVIKVEGRDNG